jgi:hypothetical protein
MPLETPRHYVPMLKTKEAEVRAIKFCTGKASMLPLFEITNDPIAKPGARVNGKKLSQAWGLPNPFFLDLETSQSSNIASFVSYSTEIHKAGGKIIPVTSPTRGVQYQQEVVNALALHQMGLALRITPEIFKNFGSSLDQFALGFGLKLSDCDIILDLGSVSQDQIVVNCIAAKAILTSLPHISKWRRIVLASGAFPNGLGQTAKNSVDHYPRADWEIWLNVLNDQGIKRKPIFGDYATVHTSFSIPLSQPVPVSPNIRYTTNTEWTIFKAESNWTAGAGGNGQYTKLCSKLVADPIFRGAAFSPGDTYIDDCHMGTDGPGNATNWQFVGFSHHLAFVVDQLANLP